MIKLYKFHWFCGRQGDVTSFFAADEEAVKAAIGKNVYFGEILGKHSEISGTLQEQDLIVLTEDQDFINKAIKYGLLNSPHNPLDYLEE